MDRKPRSSKVWRSLHDREGEPEGLFGMNKDDLIRFAADLRDRSGLDVHLELDPAQDGLHVLTIAGADFYFYADGSGYDGWGKRLSDNGV